MEDGSEVYPGQLLIQNTQELAAGPNTYEYLGKVYAQVAGHVQIIKANTWNKLPMDQVTIEPFHTGAVAATEATESAEARRRTMQPRTGDEVYARVMKVEDRFAKVDILAIGEEPIAAVFAGFIQSENVRDFDRSEVQMHLSFRPGDIIRARVT